MYNFDKMIPCDKPFVLDQDNAVAYLKHQAELVFEQAIADEHSGYGVGIAYDTAGKMFEEYVAMAQRILDDKWHYVMFYGNDMADTGLAIAKCFAHTHTQAYVDDTVHLAEKTLADMDELNNKLAEDKGSESFTITTTDSTTICTACEIIEQLISIIKGE